MPSKYIRALHHLPVLVSYGLRKKTPRDPAAALRAAADWLLAAQRAAGGTGYAHSYHLAYGWQPPYPETTGYILPTLWRANRILRDDAITDSIRRALDWLLGIQAAEGYFTDLQDRPQVFDTGQILIGLNDALEHGYGNDRVPAAIERAASWLCAVQEPDGSFIRHAYNHRPHAYYSRVGAALVKTGQLLGRADILQAGVNNLAWTMAQQHPSAFFRHSSFDDHPAFLHTMVYVAEGLLDGYELTGNRACLDAVRRFADRLLQERGTLRSQYNDDFTIANPHLCVTGIAQWAGVCLTLNRLTGESLYRDSALRHLDAARAYQIDATHPAIDGALPGSAPIGGNYLRYAFPNWSAKFFIDALLSAPQA